MARNTVTLYMDDTRVRVMVTHGRRISRLADLPLESSLAGIDSKEKETELGQKIHGLLESNKINQRKIILGISGMHCLTRPVALPELPRAMLGEAVIREARRVLPMPIEQVYLSWQAISVAGGKTNIFIVALPRQIADTALRIITQAGCKPYLMDIKPLALARLLPEPTAILLDVQPNEFDIVVMVDGIPQPVRTIAFAQEAISFPDKFGVIKEELKRTLEFVKSKVEEKQITPETTIYISGELAEHPELYETLEGEFKLKTAKLPLPLKYGKIQEPSSYLVNAGLALKEMTKEAHTQKPNCNVLPTPYLPRHIPLHKLMALPAAACAAALLVLMTTTIQGASADIRKLQNRLDTTNSLITKKQAQKLDVTASLASLEETKKQAEDEYDNYSAALKKLTTTGNTMNLDLDASVDNTDAGFTLISLSLNDAQITVTGKAESEEDVFAYIRSLMATGRFEEITISNITLSGEEVAEGETPGVTYSLSCTLKEGRE